MSQHLNLNSLTPGQTLEELYLLSKKELLTTKNGGLYGSLRLSDATAEVDAKLWERASEMLEGIEAGQVVKVWGRVQSYQGQNQVVISQIVASPNSNLADFMVQGPKSATQLWPEFEAQLKKIANPHLKRLLGAIFSPNFRARFGSAPAAKAAHHAYVGGLLEHTVSVGQLALLIAGHYPHLDRDVLLSGALLHDIGKVEELTLGPPLDYTDIGRLEGHIVLGLRMLDIALTAQKDFPQALANSLRHMLVSHHGQEEFGSPQKPKTPEAFALHVIDDLDAKTQMLQNVLASANPKAIWSGYHYLLERQIFLLDPEGKSRNSSMPDEEKDLDANELSLFRQLES